MSELNIYQRINAVMQEVAYVRKDATVQNYKAVTHDNVSAVLRPHLVKLGIVVQVEQIKGKVISMWQSKSGSRFHRYQGDYLIHFVNMDKPEDRASVPMQAHADDNADKAPGKAASYATKYAMLKTFTLETGENEEGRYHETPPFTDAQKELFHTLVEEDQAVALACMEHDLGETFTALTGTFPNGKKTQGKKEVQELLAVGWANMRESAAEIKQRLANSDPAVLEVTEEMEVSEKKIVAGMLEPNEVAQLRQIKEAASV